MKDLILFTKPECPKCDKLKSVADLKDVDVFDATTPRGMARASYYEVLKEDFPILVDTRTDERICGRMLEIKRKLSE